MQMGLMKFERSDTAVISTEGDRFEFNPIESAIGRELIQLGAVSPRSLKRNILVPFSTSTVTYLLGLKEVSSCQEESEWFELERCLEEIVGFAKQYPMICKIRDACCDHMLATLEDSNCFLMHKKFTEFDCEEHAKKTLEYIKYHLIRMVVVENTVDVEFYRLPSEDLKMLLQCDDINIDDEVQIAGIINKWIFAVPTIREKFRPMLTEAVRLYSLSKQTAGMFADFNLSGETSRKTRDIMMVVGGWLHRKACDRIEWFDPELEVWKVSEQTMPMALAYHGCVVIDDHLYVFGGSNGFKSRCETWKISPRKWMWERCDNMMEARNYISNSSVVYDGKIYVFGGQSWRELARITQRSATGEVYDPATNRWTATANLHEMRSDCAAAVYGDQIFVCGGFNGDMIVDTVEIYNPAGNFFVRHVSLPYAVSGHCLITHENQLFVIGGFSGMQREKRILVWHRSGEWKKCDEELQRGRSTSSVCVYKGAVVAVGGYSSTVDASCEILLSDPNSRIRPLPSIIRPKSALKVVVAPNWRAHLEKRGLMPSRPIDSEDSVEEYSTSLASMSGMESSNM